MHLTNENVAELGLTYVDSLVSRLGDEVCGHYLANLLRDPDYLDCALTEIEAANFLGVEVGTLH